MVWHRWRKARIRQVAIAMFDGGPGLPHDYLAPISIVANTGRRVVFYDQLGCGNSDQPHNPKMWSFQLFVEEIDAIRSTLELDQVHLFGHSAGGSLAMEYALTKPSGLVSLILADSLASVPQINSEMRRLRSELPLHVQQTLVKHEKDGTTNDPAYQAALSVFTHRHWCRLDPWPDCLLQSLQKYSKNHEVNNTLYGSSDFEITGMLREWSIVNRLGEIDVPTLLISGRYDQATPVVVAPIRRGIPDSKWVIFENSSHMPHLEEPERFIRMLGDFLNSVEASKEPLNDQSYVSNK
ncbi:MAG: proline iminopeptidase-family hydrolase [Chloroflexota bacterium]